jgi:hypothetical protein
MSPRGCVAYPMTRVIGIVTIAHSLLISCFSVLIVDFMLTYRLNLGALISTGNCMVTSDDSAAVTSVHSDKPVNWRLLSTNIRVRDRLFAQSAWAEAVLEKDGAPLKLHVPPVSRRTYLHRRLAVHVAQLEIALTHLKRSVAQEPLQDKDVAAIPKKLNGEGGAAICAGEPSPHEFLYMVEHLVHGPAAELVAVHILEDEIVGPGVLAARVLAKVPLMGLEPINPPTAIVSSTGSARSIESYQSANDCRNVSISAVNIPSFGIQIEIW